MVTSDRLYACYFFYSVTPLCKSRLPCEFPKNQIVLYCIRADMSKNREVTVRGRLKNAIRSGSAVNALSNLRSSTIASDYPMIVKSFKLVAPFEFKNLVSLGQINFRQLVYHPPLAPTSLGNELAWATAWLKGQSAKINDYRYFANQLQELVLAGDMDNASTRLDTFCSKNGWSLWAVELRLALEQQTKGTDAQKSLAEAWQSTAPNTVANLIAQIVSDRNDEMYTLDAFTWKCQNSFSRFTYNIWMPYYLWYRSFSLVDNPEKSLPFILTRELTSCLIDYYEAVIESLHAITFHSKTLSHLKSNALQLSNSLINDGYSDHRLQKILISLTGNVSVITDKETESKSILNQLIFDACTARLRWNELPCDLSPFLHGVLADIKQCVEQGAQAQEEISRLIKLGINFKSLDFGVCIGNSTVYLTSDITSGAILPLPITMVIHDWKLEDIVALDDKTIRKLLESLAQDNYCSIGLSLQAKGFLSVLDGQWVGKLKIEGSSLFLWLGRQLIIQKRWDEVLLLCNSLAELGSFWYRQSKKIQLSAFINEEKLRNALELIVQWLLKDSSYAYEFPIADIFIDRKWLDFSKLDTVLVGLVSHHAYIATKDHNIHFICKKACLTLALKGGLEFISEQFAVKSDETVNNLLLVFMRDVWIADNLSLNYFLESTAEVQNERMKVMQLLIQWDESNVDYYVQNIKELTFDQTLEHGLLQINKTRVFVNELVLYRWAEKELFKDYERWTRLVESSSNPISTDEIVRQFIVDPNNLPLLLKIGGETPSKADVVLIEMIQRLFKEFLYDPNEGLDCYLSLRIRHGSLRGTLFGALEEHGLLYSTTESFKNKFYKQWISSIKLSQEDSNFVFSAIKLFADNLKNISDALINEHIQIFSHEKPKGGIPDKIEPTQTVLLLFSASSFSEKKDSFQSFVFSVFIFFWKFIEPYLSTLGSYIRNDFKNLVQAEFDTLLSTLREIAPQALPLMSTIRTVATTTQSQCDIIADWFKPPSQLIYGYNYELSAAIEIARAATKNVYRVFPLEVRLRSIPEETLLLSSFGLSVVADCLFIVFQNSWKHSGLDTNIGILDLDIHFDAVNKYLRVELGSNLSENRIASLKAGELEILKSKYLTQNQSELSRREGGSGFAKLARFTKTIDRTLVAYPLAFDIVNCQWVIKITIPLFEREGFYDAYE